MFRIAFTPGAEWRTFVATVVKGISDGAKLLQVRSCRLVWAGQPPVLGLAICYQIYGYIPPRWTFAFPGVGGHIQEGSGMELWRIRVKEWHRRGFLRKPWVLGTFRRARLSRFYAFHTTTAKPPRGTPISGELYLFAPWQRRLR